AGVSAVAIDPVGTGNIYAARGDSVCKSVDDGGDWRCVVVGSVGRINALAIDLRAPSTLYAAATTGGFKSTSGGESWTRSLLLERPGALAIDSQSVVYAGTFDQGLWRTADGGANWARVNDVAVIRSLAVDPVMPGVVYVAAAAGLLRSRDGGVTLSSLYMNDTTSWSAQGVVAVAVDSGVPSTLYIGPASGGVLRSTDGGATWQPTAVWSPAVSDIVVDPMNSSRIYAATRANYTDLFVMKVVE